MSSSDHPEAPIHPKRPLALITGASSGIGAAIAQGLARRGYDLVMTARRQDRLDELATRLQVETGCRTWTISADLADATAPAAIMRQLADQNLVIDTLVNNAGYGVPGAYSSSDWETHQRFLQVMVMAIAELTHCCIPAMAERGQGRIINVASLAGLVPSSAGHSLYGAVKSWLIKFSESLSFELEKKGIAVTAVCPGFTYSEFHDVTGTREQVSQMANYMWMTAEQVAEQSLDANWRGQNLIINGRVNRMVAWLARHLPRWLVYRLLAREARKFRDDR